jgi:hypothetical protein
VVPTATLTSSFANLCLDVASDGTSIDISYCNGSAAQQWSFVQRGGANLFEVRSQLGGQTRCLTIAGGNTANRTPAQLDHCAKIGSGLSTTQLWRFSPSGAVTLNSDSSKCLDVRDWGTAPGTVVQIYDCAATANQQWQAYTPSVPIRSLANTCLTPTSDNQGAVVQVQPCTGASSAQWQVLPTGEIKSPSGFCLDDLNEGSANGTTIQLSTCNGLDAQNWAVQGSGEIWLYVYGKCLQAADTTAGSPVQLWDCTGTSPQAVWSLGLAAPDTSPPTSNQLKPVAVTASNTSPGSSPSYAVDGDPNTGWSSGGSPTQWIELDLGRLVAIGKVGFIAEQTSSGTLNISISVGADHSSMHTVWTGDVDSYDGKQFSESILWNGSNAAMGDPAGNIRFVRITTNSTPGSSVAWREISVYGAIEYFGYYGSGPRSTNMTMVIAGTNLDGGAIDSEVQVLAAQIQHEAAAGKKVFVRTDSLFANGGPASALSDRVGKVLVPAMQTNPDAVAGLFLVDEPYTSWNNVTKDAVNAVVAELHNTQKYPAWFTQKPVAAILDVGTLNNPNIDASYISMFDWVGFDCYRSWSDCDMSSLTSTLLQKLTAGTRDANRPGPRMIAVPWAQAPYDSATDLNPTSQNYIMRRNLDFWNTEVLSNSMYVMVFPFLYELDDVPGSDGELPGARFMPLVRERLFQLENSFLPTATPQIFPSCIWSSTDNASSCTAAAANTSGVINFYAFDRDEETTWIPDATPTSANPAWIEATFPGLTHITRVTVEPNETSNGTVQYHDLYARTPTSMTWLRSFATSSDRQVLQWTGSVDATAIEVITYRGSPWHGWREIAIYDDATP